MFCNTAKPPLPLNGRMSNNSDSSAGIPKNVSTGANMLDNTVTKPDTINSSNAKNIAMR